MKGWLWASCFFEEKTMINIKGIELDFDITSPSDMVRYKQAGERMNEAAEASPELTLKQDDPGNLDAYIKMLNTQLNLYGNFLDDVFGDGVAEKLLTNNPSLNEMLNVDDLLEETLLGIGEAFGARMKAKFDKYKPNRATRRAQK
jgi:hypothetical protein